MSDPQDTEKPDAVYVVKGFSAKVYLSQTGGFRWIPTTPTCNSIEHAQQFLDILQKMPTGRRNVWTTRLDTEQTLLTCPVIRQNPDLRKNFDQLSSAYTSAPDQNPKKLKNKTEVKPNE